MADNVDKISLDTSGYDSALSRLASSLKQHGSEVDALGVTYVDFGKKGSQLQAGFEATLSTGEKLTGFFKNGKNGVEAYVQALDKVTAATKALASASAIQAGASPASGIMKSLIPDVAGMKAAMLDSFRTVQQDLAKAIGADPANATIANDIFTNLKKGVVDVETGVRGKIQGALLDVLRLSERIAETQAKINKPTAPVGATSMSQGDLSTARGQVTSILPVDTKSSISAVASYQASINALMATVSRSKITLQDFQSLFSNVSRNPTSDFAGTNQQLGQVQSGIQRVVMAYNSMKQAAQSAGETGQRAGQSLFVSFDQFVKLIEVQIIHRVFGNLITSMQGAISKAAELQTKIAEVMTLAQGQGISQPQVEQAVRGLSEQFNRPQTDVTEAFYQGLSNQVIKSAGDVQILEEALRLSRITASTSGDAMNALSSIIRSYGLSNVEARAEADALFRTVDEGRFRLSDIANSLGRVTVIGSQMGVGMRELEAIMAHLSVTGLQPSETITQLSAIMNSFLKPSADMQTVLRGWGFETGEAAVRTMGLTGAIARLNEEVQSGRATLGDLTPNIRAIRGISGARDTGAIEALQNRIGSSGQAANDASDVVQQNIGTKFQQEILKVQNSLMDFGKIAITEITKLAEPWGGISGAVTQVGSAFGEAAKVGLEFLNVGNSILALMKPMGADIGTLIKLYLTYKASVMAVTAVQSLWSSAVASFAAIQLYSTTITGAGTVAIIQQNVAQVAATVSTFLNSEATAVNLGAKVANAAVTGVLTAAQFALAAATMAANAAMVASPFIAVGFLIAGFTGQLDSLIHQFSELKAQMDGFAAGTEALNSVLERQRTDQASAVSARESGFNSTLERTQRQGGEVFAELTRRSNALVDAQKAAVSAAGDAVKIAFRTATDEVSHAIQEITKKITQAREAIEQSRRREASFADRDASANFQHSFNALSQRPEFVTAIDTSGAQGQERYRQEEVKFQIESQQFALQKQLIQQRINTLTQEAQRATQSGSREDIETARRKFEEIRRLTTQQFDLQTGFNRRELEHEVLSGRRMTPPSGILEYNVPVQQLQRSLDALTASEGAAEEAIRSRQRTIAEGAERERVDMRTKQEALNLAIKSMQELSVLDNSGNVNRRYQGAQGSQNFNQDFAARRAQLEQALSATRQDGTSLVSPEAQAQIRSALFTQQAEMRRQLEREVAAVALREEQNLFNTRLQNIRTLRTEMLNSENNANNARTQLLRDLGTETTRMASEVADADSRLQSRNTFHPFRNGPGQDAVDERRDRFTSTLPELNAAREAFATAGPEQQAAAQTRLQAAIDATSMAYRRLFALAGDRAIGPGTTTTGTQVLENQTPLQQSASRLATATRDAASVRADLEQSTLQLTALRGQVQRTAEQMGLAGNVLGIIGQNADAAAPQVDTFTSSVQRLADQFDRLRNAALPAVPVPLPGQAPAQTGEPPSFASGGLIGGRFNSFGPDNMLASVRTGEFIVNPESSSRFYSQLVAMNAGQLPSFAQGGVVGGSSVTNVGDIHVHDSGDPNATARAVLGLLKRETRRGNGRI